MKIYLKIFLSSFLALISPVFVFAAFNDVSLTTDSALISISSVSLTLQGGNGASVEQIVVNSDTFVPTMPANSYFKVKSTDRRKFTIDPVGSLKITTTCTDTESTLELDNPASGPSVSPTIGVSTDTCAAGGGGGGGGGGGSSGGGGGGGGGGGAGIVASAPKGVAVAPVVAKPSPVAVLVSPVFNSDLQKGARNDDVRRLQELLAKDSAIYPDGSVTGFYGPLTEQAVRKFQAKYGLPQVGRVGPATRAKLQAVFGEVVAPVPAAPAPVAPVVPVPVPVVNPIQPVVPPATTVVPPPPPVESVPFWMQLQPSPRAGGASIVDPSSPSSPESPKTVEEKKAYAETLPYWMRLTQ